MRFSFLPLLDLGVLHEKWNDKIVTECAHRSVIANTQNILTRLVLSSTSSHW